MTTCGSAAAVAGGEPALLTMEVIFEYERESWTRTFSIPRGATLLDLKRSMVQPDSPPEDASAFDLHSSKARLRNYEALTAGGVLRLVYIGPEEGEARLKADLVKKRK